VKIIRLTKSQLTKLVTKAAPEYLEIFSEFKAYDGGWLVLPERIQKIKGNLKLDYYVTLYKDQKTIDVCLLLFMFGKVGLKEWNNDLKKLPPADQVQQVVNFSDELINNPTWIDDVIGGWPNNSEEELVQRKQFESLTPQEQQQQLERVSFLFLHILLSLHNYFALMAHGQKMVSLVPKAINGDDEAFCKAVRVDRNLLVSHPYFKERYQRAQANAEKEFLQKLGVCQSRANLIGKIRYPGLYLLFAMLEVLEWLDDLTHEEILDLCDNAGLDRWQNRIEDVNSVTKQLARYRKYQKTGGVSMH
jgi:hypothetical protein